MSMIDREVHNRTRAMLHVLNLTVRRDMAEALKALDEGRTDRARYLLNSGLTLYDGMSDAWQADELKREPAA